MRSGNALMPFDEIYVSHAEEIREKNSPEIVLGKSKQRRIPDSRGGCARRKNIEHETLIARRSINTKK